MIVAHIDWLSAWKMADMADPQMPVGHTHQARWVSPCTAVGVRPPNLSRSPPRGFLTALWCSSSVGLYAGHKGGDDHCMPVASVVRPLKVTSWTLVALGFLLLATGILSGMWAWAYIAVVIAMSITEWVLRDRGEVRQERAHQPHAE